MKNKLPWIDEENIVQSYSSLYHYTNFLNLGRILDSRGLLASPYTETNDREEFQAAKHILCPQISNRITSTVRQKYPEIEKAILEKGARLEEIARRDSETFYSAGLRTNIYNPFLTCFSAHESESQQKNGILSMWRSYCSGDGGIAIGFDTRKLVDKTYELLASQKLWLLFLVEVIYGNETGKLKERINDCSDLIELNVSFLESKINGKEPNFSPASLNKLLVLTSLVKHEDFSDEREIRLVSSIAVDDQDTRRAMNQIGGRFILEIADCITSIIIGPSRDQNMIAAAVEYALTARNCTGVQIRKSQTPYRSI